MTVNRIARVRCAHASAAAHARVGAKPRKQPQRARGGRTARRWRLLAITRTRTGDLKPRPSVLVPNSPVPLFPTTDCYPYLRSPASCRVAAPFTFGTGPHTGASVRAHQRGFGRVGFVDFRFHPVSQPAMRSRSTSNTLRQRERPRHARYHPKQTSALRHGHPAPPRPAPHALNANSKVLYSSVQREAADFTAPTRPHPPPPARPAPPLHAGWRTSACTAYDRCHA